MVACSRIECTWRKDAKRRSVDFIRCRLLAFSHGWVKSFHDVKVMVAAGRKAARLEAEQSRQQSRDEHRERRHRCDLVGVPHPVFCILSTRRLSQRPRL